MVAVGSAELVTKFIMRAPDALPAAGSSPHHPQGTVFAGHLR